LIKCISSKFDLKTKDRATEQRSVFTVMVHSKEHKHFAFSNQNTISKIYYVPNLISL